MYGAMREHAPGSTRLAGAITAAAATLAFGYMMANGMGNYIAGALPDPIVYETLPEVKDDPAPATEKLELASDVSALPVPEPLVDKLVFTYDDGPVTGSTDPEVREPPGPAVGAAIPPSPKPVRVGPKMLPMTPPPYPTSPLRSRQEGVSGLEVCLDQSGKVTSATLASSSGHAALDQAALKWVRNLRFTPAKLDGAPQAICGHSVLYEWRLRDAR